MILEEGQTVWIANSNSGYTGPAVLVGHVFGQTWLVKILNDAQVIAVRTDFIKPIAKYEHLIPSVTEEKVLSKEERRRLKNKLKAERKNHRPPSNRRR